MDEALSIPERTFLAKRIAELEAALRELVAMNNSSTFNDDDSGPPGECFPVQSKELMDALSRAEALLNSRSGQ